MTPGALPICVDASVAIRVLTGTSTQATLLEWAGWEDNARPLVAPALFHYEVCNALHSYTRSKLLSEEAIDILVQDALGLPIQIVDDDALHREALAAARRYDIGSVYDAHYLALSERLGTRLVTADARLHDRVKEAAPWVLLME